MKYNEIEVKFYIENPKKIKEKILLLGLDSFGKHFEVNVKYKNQQHDPTARNLLVRLRKSNKIVLTIKQFPENKNKEFKISRELEVAVSDFATMDEILNILGYYKEQVYEKWREEWKYGKTILCLDRLPYGCFLEIEGQPDSIRTMAKKLKLKWKKRITLSYLEIFEILKKEESYNFNDLEFKSFRNYQCLKNYLPLIESRNLDIKVAK